MDSNNNEAKKEKRPYRKRKKSIVSEDTTGDAKRNAALVLEVLAGSLKPVDAAEAMGICANAYYKYEERALMGLVEACEPKAGGRSRPVEKEIEELQKKCRQLESDCVRYQTLARASQKAFGMNIKNRPKPGEKGKKHAKRPVVRALVAAKALKAEVKPEVPAGDKVETG